MSDFLIREAEPADYQAVANLWEDVFPTSPYQLAVNVTDTNGETINLVAVDGTKVIGFMTLEKRPTYGAEEWRKYPAYIAGMCVHASCRSRGVGGEMFLRMLFLVLERLPQDKMMYLHVHVNNPRGIQFWERQGFVKISTHTNSKGSTQWLMEKPIGAPSP